MIGRYWKLPAFALVLCLGAGAAPLGAQGTICKDATTSATTGRGACSGHGGVDGKATAKAKKAARAARGGPITYQPAAPGTVTCTDGTSSANGRGACSHHGGIARSGAAVSPPAAAPAPMPAPATAPMPTPSRSAPTPRASTGTAQSPQPTNAPAGATAQCRDGTYSHSAHRRGTCSHHGGVATWM